MNVNTPENDQEPKTALNILESLLHDSGQKKINENQVIIILDAVANAEDAAVVARFPAVLAICARRGLSLNSQVLLSRYWETSPKRQNLEKLLLVSAEIFNRQGLDPPKNLEKIAASLKTKYNDLMTTGELQLSSGLCIAVQDLQNTLKGYSVAQLKSRPNHRKITPERTCTLEDCLERLFSPKQKELVLKKRDGKTFTKTEREYYSRVVRKKLDAIANKEVMELANKLVRI
jgi:hypothetical protein